MAKPKKKGRGTRKNNEALLQNLRVVRVVTGIVFAVLALYTLAVLISYIFTWSKDASLVSNPEMLDASQGVKNIGGKLGFLWSNLLFSRLFGFGAFAVPVFLGALSAFFLRIRRLNLLRVFILCFFGAILFRYSLPSYSVS